jgi:DNA-directed RNA polymerase specialized sigma24 family protein
MQRPSFFHDDSELGEEERLVARCLRGDNNAWEMMFNLYHPQLVSIIKAMMHGEGAVEQAEEIAAAVWSSLCGEAFTRLRHYDPQVGRLLGYLASMARGEIRRGRRSKRSRYSREFKAARKEATSDEIGRGLVIQEFLATLTPREREFCMTDLMLQTKPMVRPDVSLANGWQLRSRVLRKFRTYLSQENSRE